MKLFLPPFLAIAAAVCAGFFLAFLTTHQAGLRFLSSSPALSGPAAKPVEDTLGLEVFAKPRPFPNLSFNDAFGRTIDLAAFRGRVVLFNIWAPSCAPCREEMASLDRLEAKLGARGLFVLPVAVDRTSIPAVRRFYRGVGIKRLPVYVDPSDRIPEALLVPGIPASFVIDRDGRSVARQLGPAQWDDPQMVAFLRRYLPMAPAVTTEAQR